MAYFSPGHISLTSAMELNGSILVSGNADSTVKVPFTYTAHKDWNVNEPQQLRLGVTCN